VGGLTHAFSSVGGYGAGVHLLVSAAAAPVLFLALIRLHLVPDLSRRRQLHQRLGIGLIGFSAGFSAGILHELYVFAANHVLDAGFAVDYGILIRRLALDVVGALGGAVLLVLWATFGWSTRRLPGQALTDVNRLSRAR
jgi:hypothetical protein